VQKTPDTDSALPLPLESRCGSVSAHLSKTSLEFIFHNHEIKNLVVYIYCISLERA
jgi:hypothetical protein